MIQLPSHITNRTDHIVTIIKYGTPEQRSELFWAGINKIFPSVSKKQRKEMDELVTCIFEREIGLLTRDNALLCNKLNKLRGKFTKMVLSDDNDIPIARTSNDMNDILKLLRNKIEENNKIKEKLDVMDPKYNETLRRLEGDNLFFESIIKKTDKLLEDHKGSIKKFNVVFDKIVPRKLSDITFNDVKKKVAIFSLGATIGAAIGSAPYIFIKVKGIVG